MSNWEIERKRQRALMSCNSLAVALPVVVIGVAGAILGAFVVVVVVVGIGCGADHLEELVRKLR
ncbi:MAG: hypothetical protein ACKPKO_09295, partial [Candidatus Fonsibacter sp.]